jgi:hypothetical protein
VIEDYQKRTITIAGADFEDSVTNLLRSLLKQGKVTGHPAIETLRSLLSGGGQLVVPLLDLVAVLPDPQTRDLKGLHVASYQGSDEVDEWYPKLLREFFSTGGKGSLLALQDFPSWVGKCHFSYPSSKASDSSRGVTRNHTRTASMPFSPKPKTVDYSVEKRFREYARPLLAQFEGPAAVAWICFGPRGESSLQWGGSLFFVIQSTTASDLFPKALAEGIERVYSLLNASFHRTIVDSGHREEEAYRLRLTYFAFGHDLKNRIANLGMDSLRRKISTDAPKILAEVDECGARLKILAGMCGVFSAVAKFEDGVLPTEWVAATEESEGASASLGVEGAAKLRAALIEAVTQFVYVEDWQQRLTLRYVENDTASHLARPASFEIICLPPFAPEVPEPHLCFFSGLAELCRNAARIVLAASPKYRAPHVDFSVTVTDTKAVVSLVNPVKGNQRGASQSVGILSDLFDRYLNGIVELRPSKPIDNYPHALAGLNYVQSEYLYFPARIRTKGL